MIIHVQRQGHDCGVAALASFIGARYEDVYCAAIATSDSFMRREGLTIVDMVNMAAGFGRTLVRVHYRRVDLDEHTGVLGVNWHRSMWKKHGAPGHWVNLWNGIIYDPSGPEARDAHEYLCINKGRAGTLLKEQ
jgi:hypothetical protein